MKNWQKGLGLLAAAAFATVPAIASAQSASDSTAQQGMDQQASPQQVSPQPAIPQQAGTVQQPGMAQQQQPGMGQQQVQQPADMSQQFGTGSQSTTMPRGGGPQGAQAATTIPINGQFSFPLANNCTYQATVRGSARPARGAVAGAEQLYVPNVNVDATVSCPSAQQLHVSERVANQQPMTLRQLEQSIELRASLMIDSSSGAHCAYVPDFQLSQQQIQGAGAALLCPLPAQAGAQGGGPQGVMP